MQGTPSEATNACEASLQRHRRYNVEHKILPSENIIIDRLLGRREELVDAYADAYKKLRDVHQGLYVYFDVLLGVARLWSPQKMAQAREARRELELLNKQIAEQAEALAAALRQRGHLHNHSGFASETHYHVGDLIDAAAEHNDWYTTHLRSELEVLRYRYDLKYWPSLPDILTTLADDARSAEIAATDSLTEAGTSGLRSSPVDFLKAVFRALDQGREAYGGFLPATFIPSDAALASLANCLLDLPADELLDATYVKNARQRHRPRRKNVSSARSIKARRASSGDDT